MMMQTLSFPCISPPTVRFQFKCRATVQSLSPPKMSDSASLYDVLRVNRNASTVEIKAAYRNLAKVYHPDASSSSSSSSSASSSSSSASSSSTSDGDDFIKIHNAYETLSDPAARALYDLSLGFGIGIGIENPNYPFSTPSSSATSPFGCYSVGRRPSRRWETDQCW